MKISIVGAGYVGLVTGGCFADLGHQVLCIDSDAEKVATLNAAGLPIYEPGLQELMARNRAEGRIHFTTDMAQAVEHGEVIFIAVGTPSKEDGSADLSYIMGVAKQLSHLIKDYKIIIDKSTVPVGTAEKVHAIIAENTSETLFDVVSNPEFLREGVAVEDFMKPDRVVIGTNSERARKVMKQLYEPFVRQGNPIYFMDERSAEMTKYAANSYLATRISFMNEIANLCEKVGANVDMVRMGMGSDSRIGKRFLFPGVGYGGSCFPKDVQALARTATDFTYDFRILSAVMGVNDRQRYTLAEKIKAYFGEDLSGRTIGIWGLAFKPNTDDIREAPALYTIESLLDAGATIKAFDPEAMENIHRYFGDRIELCKDQYEVLINADALAIITEWSVFRTPSFQVMKELMKHDVIFDGRNLYDLEAIADHGFHYHSIGRESVGKKPE
jgi:UDPglucose 6-dehydrogenase